MRKCVLCWGAAALLAAPGSAAEPERLANAQIVQLVKVGLGDEAILAKIAVSQPDFDTSTDALVALRRAGVPSPVIAAMIRTQGGQMPLLAAASPAGLPSTIARPLAHPVKAPLDGPVPSEPGLFLREGEGLSASLRQIRPGAGGRTRTTNFFAFAMSGGILPVRYMASLPGAASATVTRSLQPVFLFNFGADETAFAEQGGSALDGYSLVRLTAKEDRREAKVGHFGMTGARAGISKKASIAFHADVLAPGLYRVVPEAPLEPGEYAFIQPQTTGRTTGKGAITALIFDFSVRP